MSGSFAELLLVGVPGSGVAARWSNIPENRSSNPPAEPPPPAVNRAPPRVMARIWSYCWRCSASERTEYASPISLNLASAAASPAFWSGCSLRASLRYVFLIVAASASEETPRMA